MKSIISDERGIRWKEFSCACETLLIQESWIIVHGVLAHLAQKIVRCDCSSPAKLSKGFEPVEAQAFRKFRDSSKIITDNGSHRLCIGESKTKGKN